MPKEFNIPGLKDVISDIEKLTEKSKAAAQELLNAATSAEKALQPFKNNTGLKDYVELQKKSTDVQKDTNTAALKLEQAQVKLAFAQSDLGKKIAAVNLETQRQNLENKQTAAQMTESASALQKYNAIVLKSTNDAKNLGAQLELLKMEGKENTEEFKKLEKEFISSAESAKKLNDRYRDISKAAGDNRALVGSYSDELKGHFKTLETSLTGLFSNLQSSLLKGNFKGAFNELRTVVTGFGSEVKGINDVVVGYATNLFNFGSANAAATATVDVNTASIMAETAATDASAISTDAVVVSKIGFVQSETAAAIATDTNTISQEAAIAVSEGLTIATEANSISKMESVTAAEAESFSAIEAAAAQAELSATQVVGIATNEGLTASAISATLSNEALAVSESEAAIAAAALSTTTGSAAVGTAALAGAETVAAVAGESLAVGATSAAVGVGLLDVVLGILLAPITLIILALGLLFYIFKDFAPIVNPIKDAFSALAAVFKSIGQDIFDLVTGARSLSEILDVFGTKCADAAKEAYDLGQATRDLNKAMEIQEVTSAKVSTEIQLLLLRGRDLSKSYDERNKNLEKAIQLEKEKSSAELKNNAEAIRIQAVRLFEGKELTAAVKKAIDEQDFAKIRSLKVKMNLDKDELESYKKLLIEKENLEKAAISVEEKAQNRINKNIQRKEEAEKRAADAAKKAAEKAEADAEKRAKENLDRQKKTAEEGIRVMKITLDNLITNYDQSSKLDEENLAHVRAISEMKIQIAAAELEKQLIGVKKGSIDERSILNANAQEIIKINAERDKAINKISVDRQKFELEIYDLTHQSILDGSKDLTDQLIDEEKRRMQESLAIHKEHMRQELKIDKDTTDEKLRIYARSGAQLSENELKYLQFIEKEDSATNKQIKKNSDDLIKVKLKAIDTEESTNVRKFNLLQKGSNKNQIFEFKQIDDKLKKERKVFEEEEKRLKTEGKDYSAAAQKIKDIDLQVAENRQKLNKFTSENKKEALLQGLDILIDVAGKETAVGKTAAIAQATINTYTGATRALKDYAYPYGGIVAGLVIAQGLLTVGKILNVEGFAKGTKNAPYTGVAMVDEEGAEIHTDQYGRIKSMGSEGGAHLTNIVKGDRIIPADISAIIKQTMFSNYKIKGDQASMIDYDKIGDQFGTHANRIVGAIRSRKSSRIQINVNKNSDSEVSLKGKKV